MAVQRWRGGWSTAWAGGLRQGARLLCGTERDAALVDAGRRRALILVRNIDSHIVALKVRADSAGEGPKYTT